MATINSVTNGGEYHFDDPNAWSGGVVPGKGDVAVIQHTFTRINSGSGYHFWNGVKDKIVVDSVSNLGFEATSGSFFTYTYPGCHRVQITYDSTGSNQFNNVRISSSYTNSKGESPTWTDGVSGSFVGIIRNDAPVFSSPTTIFVSASATWHVNRVKLHDQGNLIVKDNAHLALDSDSQDAYIEVEDGCVKILGNVTCSLSGSTERNSGLIQHDDVDYGVVLISGSSDLRTRTTVASASAAGVGKIIVPDASGFGQYDWISIYHDSKDDHRLNISPDGNNTVEYYSYGSSPSTSSPNPRPSSSVYPQHFRGKFRDNNESLQIVSASGNTLVVSKLYAREGEVVETNSFSRDKFLREKGVVKNFSGNRTLITVRSGHNTFREGDKIAAENGVVATVLKVRDKLLPYKNIDFATDNDPLSHFIIDPFIGSGSNHQYAVTSNLVTGSFGLSIGTGSNNSFGVDYGTSDSKYRRIFLKDTKFRDVKVTISASQFGGPQGTSYDGDRMAGVQIQQCPYLRTRAREFYSGPDDSPGPFIGIYSDDVYFGKEPGDYLQVDTDNSPFSGTPQRTHPSTMTIDSKRLSTSYTWNGHLLANTFHNGHAGSITLNLRGFDTTIRSMVVQEYVQELLLDTTQAIPVGTEIYETGTIVPHTTDQKIVKTAYGIKDIRGYKNLLAVYAQHEEANDPDALASGSIPCYFSNEGNTELHQNSSTTDSRSSVSRMFYQDNDYDRYFRTQNSGDREFVLNLGEQTIFDAVSINGRYFSSHNSRTATLNGFGVEVSDDGHNFTVVRTAANDTRKPRGQAGVRMFKFDTAASGSFLKIKVNGGSASSNNYITYLGLHHFNGRGDTIELYNASGLEVGNTIAIVKSKADYGSEYAYVNYGNWRTNAKAGSETDANYVGGFDHNYKITAIDGNVITLNKTIEAQTIAEDDLIVKLDRSITVKSDNFIPFGPYYSNNNDSIMRYEYYNTAFMNMGNSSRELLRLYSYAQTANAEFTNCVFNHMEYASNYSNDGGKVFNNNVYINFNTLSQRGSRRYSNTCTHGNIYYGYYYLSRSMIGLQMHNTGNIIHTTRYYIGHYHGGPEQPSNIGHNIIRNNYYVFGDYMELDPADVGYMQYITKDLEYYDNVVAMHGAQGYFRDIGMFQNHHKSKRRIESSRLYPPVFLNPINTYNHTNINTKRQSTGNDGQYSLALIQGDGMETQFRPMIRIGAGRSAYILKENTKDEFEFITEHHNRNAQPIFIAKFNVFTRQNIRINVSFDKYNDKGFVYNQRSSDSSTPRIMVVGPDGRTIGPAEKIEHNEFPYQTFTFEKFITNADPGSYIVVVNQFSYMYAGIMMHYKNPFCQIKGTNPSGMQIVMNGFFNHLLFNNPDLVTENGGLDVGTEPIVDNPAKTTIRFRKIRF